MSSQIITAPNVQIIPVQSKSTETKKIRTVCYARVSSDHDCQTLSYETQKNYFIEYINSQENLEFVGFYGDEAISDTNRKRRVQFNQMMEDAKAHKFDLILTKSLSRWARNTLDSIACIRELKALDPPVRVIFQKENIDTLDGNSELIFTIMSALAQEESRSISENIRWSIQKKFQNGEPIINLDFTMGYDKGEDGKWVVNPEQAAIVQYIYENYADGLSATEIARQLNARGIKTARGREFRSDAVLRILRSELYAGNVILQKNVTVDFLSHQTVKNEDHMPQYFIEGHHPAIISPELLARVEQKLNGIRYKRPYTKINVLTFAFNNLTLIDGTPLQRMPYRVAAVGYKDENGEGGYFFQNPVAKTVNLSLIPGTDKTYLSAAAIEQSFMEMLYRLKREYKEKGKDAGFYRQAQRLLLMDERTETEKRRLLMIDDELKTTGELYRKAVSGKEHAVAAGRDADQYIAQIQDIERKLEELNRQKTELEGVYSAAMIEENLADFVTALKELPEKNALGQTILVNGLDCISIFANADGSINESRLQGYRRGNFHLTPDKLQRTPELLKFEEGVYRKFIKKGTVMGDEIVYETNFGVTLRSYGNARTLRHFFGFKKVSADGTIGVVLGVWEVRDSKLFQPGMRKKQAAEDSRALEMVEG